MSQLVPRGSRGVELPVGTWRERHQLADARQRAMLDEFDEYAEAVRLDTRMSCARRLADRAATELVFTHEQFGDLAAGDTALELDLRDLERVLARGLKSTLHNYLSRW